MKMTSIEILFKLIYIYILRQNCQMQNTLRKGRFLSINSVLGTWAISELNCIYGAVIGTLNCSIHTK